MSNLMTQACRPVVLSPAQKAVLMCIADYAHDDGQDWHSVAAYCAWTCLSKTAVLDALKALEAAGLIVIDRRNGARSTTTLQRDALAIAAPSTGAPAGPVRLPDRSVSRSAPVCLPDRTGVFAGPKALEASEASVVARQPSKRMAKTSMPKDFAISEEVRRWAKVKGFVNLDDHLEAFVLKCEAKGYTYNDWDAALKSAIRDDWAKLRQSGAGASLTDHNFKGCV